MQQPVVVTSIAEEYAYLTAQPCSSCAGPWQVERQALVKDEQGTLVDQIDVICRRCGASCSFLFDVHLFFSPPHDE